ncbi:MAG: UDP-N-acetylglucosamine 1-carboxyvinyltransferase [Candidatus Daviesbacteria bacterium GW2011_GWA2_42_7]|uniref:UDP-N-acetylglucosamine 1-carboxyvinyltransferase n=1 Tax=Candidatus Daviesbacteria bacterium GW2011_GWA2_42_7 TaxID=1618425 RepID=A0A0G1B9N7_9BACT|nr:MAG: UDP-N-acetylglucosamine 1-carboxyvinyltransferase [Candidatus Daviesbacteria bacterium GW2011_GWA2_42_7]
MSILEFIPNNGSIFISAKKINPIPKIITNIWPGFPTDLMSVVIILASQAEGVSLLHDWMYESRMFFVDKLISMGAHMTIADPHRVLVYGPSKLMGRNLETPDIRAGMALVLAALVAKGESIINRAELIDRGYEDVVGKLLALGANIKKID